MTLAARPAEPTASAARLRDLLRWQLERRQTEARAGGQTLFGGGMTEFELRLEALTPAMGQALSLFSGERAGHRNVSGAVERLEALLGPERVRRAVAADGRRPEECFGWAPFRPEVGAARRPPTAPPRPTPADRVRPLPLAPVADGLPSPLDGPGPTNHAPALRLFDPPRPCLPPLPGGGGVVRARGVRLGNESRRAPPAGDSVDRGRQRVHQRGGGRGNPCGWPAPGRRGRPHRTQPRLPSTPAPYSRHLPHDKLLARRRRA